MMELGSTANNASILHTDVDKKHMMNVPMKNNGQLNVLNSKPSQMFAMRHNNAESMDLQGMTSNGMNTFLMPPSQMSSQIPQYMMEPMQQIMQMQHLSNTTSQSGSIALQTLYPQLATQNAQQNHQGQNLPLELNKESGSKTDENETNEAHGTTSKKSYRDASLYADPPVTRGRNCGGVTEPFPEKLHTMLKYVEKENLTDIVSFLPHGRAFAVHIPKRFVTEVMPIFFRQTRITSFQRQLNLYGFQRICQGPDSGAYYHELFLRGRPGLVANMRRTKVKGTMKVKRDPSSDPDFYAMPPVVGDNQCSTFSQNKHESNKDLEQKQNVDLKNLTQKNQALNGISPSLGNLTMNQVQQGLVSSQSSQMMPLQQKLHLQALTQSSTKSLSGQPLVSMQAQQQSHQTQLQQIGMPPAALLPKVLAHPGMLNSMQFSQQQQSQMMLPMQFNTSVQSPMLLYAAKQEQAQRNITSPPGLGAFQNIQQLKQQQQQQQEQQQNQQLQLMQSQFGSVSQNPSSFSSGMNGMLPNTSLSSQHQLYEQQQQHRDILQAQNQNQLNPNRNAILSLQKFQAQGFDGNSAKTT